MVRINKAYMIKNKSNNKRISIRKIAALYDGRSQSCSKCKKKVFFCLSTGQFDICRERFIEGFIKGVKYWKEQIKNHKEIDN